MWTTIQWKQRKPTAGSYVSRTVAVGGDDCAVDVILLIELRQRDKTWLIDAQRRMSHRVKVATVLFGMIRRLAAIE